MAGIELVALVQGLRDDSSDTAAVEAKAAARGLPTGLDKVVCALANRPGGGVVILGLDERAGFATRPVWNLSAAQQSLSNIARTALEPPVTVEISTKKFEGERVVLAEVTEMSAAVKPCRIRATGKAYLRSHDGTYEMSDAEVAGLVANRARPGFDRHPVVGASVERDLDPALVDKYRGTCRASSSALARRDDEDLLVRTGVVTVDGVPTVAGLLALGVYPQQFFPSFVIRASVAPGPSDPPGTRAADVRNFDGPIPTMLEEAAQWVQRNTRTRVRFGSDGHGVDEPEYPAAAIRELVANALIHRDLGPHAASYPVTLTLEHHRLVVSNPGGLWGITVDRLGLGGVSSARNDVLLGIAKNVRTGADRRVVEGLATGLQTVLSSLKAAGMVEPRFVDQGVRFTVVVPNHSLLGADDLAWLTNTTEGLGLTDTQRHALVAMRHGVRWTNSSFRERFPRDSTQARVDLQALVDAGLALADGERGARTYALAEVRVSNPHSQPDLLTSVGEAPPRPPRPNPHVTTLRVMLALGPTTASDLATRSKLTLRQVSHALRRMRRSGEVVVDGGRGVHSTTYALAPTSNERGR